MGKLKSITKTWKIGEYARGGVITVEITGKVIVVICKEWDFSTGSRRSSDQSNAKELYRCTCTAEDEDVERKLLNLLCDMTTSYYADQLIKWIKTKVELHKSLRW
jgi:hypothetical protein